LLDELQSRIAQLAREDAVKAERAEISGEEVMSHLGIGPGREVGEAMRYLLELKRAEGILGEEEVRKRLDQWWLTKRT
jgi:poly(A) polymerase